MRVVIVDDERLARDRLKQLLAVHPDVQIVGEADSPASALAVIDATRPNVVFLDVEMGDGTGFDVIERSTAPFHAIFVTAFPVHAVRAFDVNATDYLLKPVAPDRLARALERFTSARPTSAELGLDDHVCLTQDQRPRFVRVRNIVSVTAAGPYSEVRTAEGAVVLVHRSTQAWEAILTPGTFRRVHRSAIVNLDHVADAEPLLTGGYRLQMRVGPPLLVSRRYAAQLRREQGDLTPRGRRGR